MRKFIEQHHHLIRRLAILTVLFMTAVVVAVPVAAAGLPATFTPPSGNNAITNLIVTLAEWSLGSFYNGLISIFALGAIVMIIYNLFKMVFDHSPQALKQRFRSIGIIFLACVGAAITIKLVEAVITMANGVSLDSPPVE